MPISLYGLVDDEGDPVDLVPDTATCAMYNMEKITTPKQCLRAAQELGYCGNIEQHFLVRNSTGHIQVGEGPVQTLRESWQSKKQCESCPEYLNQKITGPVLLGEMYEEKGCENGTSRVIRTMEVPECQTTAHENLDDAFSWEYKCNEAGDEVTVIPFPEGTSDCSGRSTTFGTGVWADLYKYDKSYQTDVWEDNFFSTVQPVIVLAHINNPQCAPEEDPYPCHWFPTSSKLKWNECSNRQSSKKEQFTLEGRQYKSLKWSCFKDPNSGKNPFRICGNATEPPPTARSAETDTHEYPHEDKWPSGCFVYEESQRAQLVFNDNFESEALCTDSGDATNSMRCLCRPPTANDAYNGYDPNEAELKAKGLVLRCMSNGWCGYLDENDSAGRWSSSRVAFMLFVGVLSIVCLLS